MRVWIIERDHEPMEGMTAYRDDREGTADMKRVLNHLQRDQNHYHDAVLYERIEPGGKFQNLEREA